MTKWIILIEVKNDLLYKIFNTKSVDTIRSLKSPNKLSKKHSMCLKLYLNILLVTKIELQVHQ